MWERVFNNNKCFEKCIKRRIIKWIGLHRKKANDFNKSNLEM